MPKGDGTKYVVLDPARLARSSPRCAASKDRDVELTLAPGNYHIKKVLPDRLEVGSLVLAAGEAARDATRSRTSRRRSRRASSRAAWTTCSPEEQPRLATQPGVRPARRRPSANAALALFDRLLRDDPADIRAWRGRARALVRIAEAYQTRQRPTSRAARADRRAQGRSAADRGPELQALVPAPRRARRARQAVDDRRACEARRRTSSATRARRSTAASASTSDQRARHCSRSTRTVVVKRMVFPRVGARPRERGPRRGHHARAATVALEPVPRRRRPRVVSQDGHRRSEASQRQVDGVNDDGQIVLDRRDVRTARPRRGRRAVRSAAPGS